MKKPKIVIALSIILFLSGIIGVLGGAAYFIKGLPIIGSVVGFITTVQGMVALAASIGLWRLTDWAEKAFIAWASICVVRLIFMRLFVYPVPFLRIVLGVGLIFVLFIVIHKYTFQKHKNLFYIVDIDNLEQKK